MCRLAFDTPICSAISRSLSGELLSTTYWYHNEGAQHLLAFLRFSHLLLTVVLTDRPETDPLAGAWPRCSLAAETQPFTKGAEMAVEFITSRIHVPRGRGRRQLNGSVSFQRKVRVANIALRGFLLDFVTSDHHINVVEVTTDFAARKARSCVFG